MNRILAVGMLLIGTLFLAAASPIPLVHEIELIGVRAVSPEEIEASIEVVTGAPVDRNAALRTLENIRQLYLSRGYESARVRSEMVRKSSSSGKLENVVQIFVEEGPSTRIAELDFKAIGEAPGWEDRRALLLRRVAIAAGDLADQEKLQLARRLVQDELASQEYVGARVVDVKRTEAAPPAVLPESVAALGEEGGSSVKWVKLVFEIELGDRVTFGFQGNSVFSRSDILTWIDEMRVVGFSTDYVSAIRDRILQEYRAAAYLDAEVTPFTFERKGGGRERHVTYRIREGKRISIGKLVFDGNQIFKAEELESQFFSRAPLLTSRRYFVEAEAQRSSELLIEWIRSQGYLSARFMSLSRARDAVTGRMDLTVYLYEGDQTKVDHVVFSGMNAITREEALSLLRVKEGEPLNLYAFSQGIEALKQEYRNRGYLDALIRNEESDDVVKYVQENRLADIRIDVVEGPLFRLSSVQIEGLKQTKPEVVEREVAVEKEGILSEALILKTDARLKRLGIFSRVAVRAIADPDRADAKVLQISIDEADPGLIAGGVGFRTDLGLRAFGQIAYTNLWQRNHTASFLAAANQRFDNDGFCRRNQNALGDGCFAEFQAETSYHWPWFGIPGMSFRPKIVAERTMYLNFNKSAIAFSASFDKQLFEKPNLTLGLTYHLERVHQYGAVQKVDDKTLYIGSLTPSLRLDLRDNPLLPNEGILAVASYEIANPVFLSQSDPFPVAFTSLNFRSDYHLTFWREIHAYFSFRTGIQRNMALPPPGDPENLDYRIPISRQFSLGGVGSLRGFQEQGLNVDDVAIRGYLTYVNYRTQIDFPFAGALRFGPFLDAANLLIDTYSLGKLRYGAGFGFHFRSPVGPVNFDWGFNLQPRPREDTNRFYFSIGIL